MAKLSIFATVLIFLLISCTGIPLKKVRTDLYSGNFDQADLILKKCRGVSKKDRLLCFMEGGITLYDIKAYQESTKVLMKASQLIKKQDLVNISDQSSAVLINDKVMAYKGEYCERLWVHTFLMMNYLLQYDYESALVEAKQALEVIDEYPDSLEDDYFTRALIALCFENMNFPDDARIEYNKLREFTGNNNFIPGSIVQGKGELVLFIGQGYIPTKVSVDMILPPSYTRISIPQYAESFSPLPVTVRSDRGMDMDTPVQVTTDLGEVARESLDDRAAQYLTRHALRSGTKEYIVHRLGEKNEFIEVLVRALFFLSEEADTRSWEALPENLTLIRIYLDAGVHDLEISTEYSQTVYLSGIDIHEGKRLYRSIRF